MDKIKYVAGMSCCTKDSDETLYSIDTPATITVSCKFEHNSLCTQADSDCDFRHTLNEEDVDMLNER